MRRVRHHPAVAQGRVVHGHRNDDEGCANGKLQGDFKAKEKDGRCCTEYDRAGRCKILHYIVRVLHARCNNQTTKGLREHNAPHEVVESAKDAACIHGFAIIPVHGGDGDGDREETELDVARPQAHLHVPLEDEFKIHPCKCGEGRANNGGHSAVELARCADVLVATALLAGELDDDHAEEEQAQGNPLLSGELLAQDAYGQGCCQEELCLVKELEDDYFQIAQRIVDEVVLNRVAQRRHRALQSRNPVGRHRVADRP
mmetsp:Transcript_13123/g.38577  ORF Transcript_13123/g.38577 Transcript_13123/m.38577 type:complete len:258 (+) Transcript_13123:229-1002(+)